MTDLRDELENAPVEPLLPIEKKLIGWSLWNWADAFGWSYCPELLLSHHCLRMTRAETQQDAVERKSNRSAGHCKRGQVSETGLSRACAI